MIHCEEIGATHRAHMREIQEFLLPNSGNFLIDRQKLNADRGGKTHGKIINGSATRALRFAASGIHGGLTSPAQKWMEIRFADADLQKSGYFDGYIQQIERMFYALFRQSNFYAIIHKSYYDEIGYGTSVIVADEDPESTIHNSLIPMGEYSLATNRKGVVDTLYRRISITAIQAEGWFGKEKLTAPMLNALRTNPYTEFIIFHCIRPNQAFKGVVLGAERAAYESIIFTDTEDYKILEHKGYSIKPFTASRWGTVGTFPYGYSPGQDLLGEIKDLQQESLAIPKALHKMIDPPLMGPASLLDEVDFLPGGLSPVESTEQKIEPIYQVNFNVRDTAAHVAELIQQIKEGFFNDLFIMITQRPQMTATEIAERHEEKLWMLGPVIESQFTEKLDPLLDRYFDIMTRNEMLPQPPPELEGQPLKIEYISMLAQAQKMVNANSLHGYVSFIGQLAELNPEAIDNLNVDEAAASLDEIASLPAGVRPNIDQIQKIREQRAEQQQAQQQAEQQAQAADSAQKLSQTDMEGKNALTELVKSNE